MIRLVRSKWLLWDVKSNWSPWNRSRVLTAVNILPRLHFQLRILKQADMLTARKVDSLNRLYCLQNIDLTNTACMSVCRRDLASAREPVAWQTLTPAVLCPLGALVVGVVVCCLRWSRCRKSRSDCRSCCCEYILRRLHAFHYGSVDGRTGQTRESRQEQAVWQKSVMCFSYV